MASTIEKAFLQELLVGGTRADGRKLKEARPVTIKFGAEYGSVEVTMGKTRLAVHVSASVKKPRDNRPFEGLFHISTEISPMAHPKFENSRQGPEEIVLARVIEKAIRRSNALDLESLCIVAGQSCWMVRADVHYLDYDGGLVDATCIGVITALLHYRRPDTSIDGDRVIVHTPAERPPVALSIIHIPLCVTWSVFAENILAVDASATEQELELGNIIITINRDRDICQLMKSGGPALSPAEILQCCERAHGRAKELTEYIQKRLREDNAIRNKGNLGADLAANDR